MVWSQETCPEKTASYTFYRHQALSKGGNNRICLPQSSKTSQFGLLDSSHIQLLCISEACLISLIGGIKIQDKNNNKKHQPPPKKKKSTFSAWNQTASSSLSKSPSIMQTGGRPWLPHYHRAEPSCLSTCLCMCLSVCPSV